MTLHLPNNGNRQQLAYELLERQCNAMLRLKNGVWTRCGVSPTELHHRLTRSRGGLILDQFGETYHLMRLCNQHHKFAHESTNAHVLGLMLEGYVTTHGDRPKYSGPDEYLSSVYA